MVSNWKIHVGTRPGMFGVDVSIYRYEADGKLHTMIEAPKLNPEPVDRLFVASLMRRATKIERGEKIGGVI